METINIADKLIPNNPSAYSFLRILTGMIILVRGFNFIFVTTTLQLMIRADVAVFAAQSATLSVIIAVLDIACGLFITVGFVTRTSAIIQIPILFVAAFIINMRHIGQDSFEFILSAVTFFLVILIAYRGSGPFSADEYFKRGAAFDRDGDNRR
jgi:uncharacterized membrane protein YphA (DoxX/SURF4 family)